MGSLKVFHITENAMKDYSMKANMEIKSGLIMTATIM